MNEIVFTSAFQEMAVLVILAAAVGFIGVTLRQPLVVSFIVVGLLAGPSAFDLVHSAEHVELLAELGVAALLFLVGLKLDIGMLRTVGRVATLTGLGQVIFTSVIGYGICIMLGLDPLTSLYVAVALTFSSTIIIVKLLSDKREIDSLHGRIALGFLIVQDLVVVLAMIVLSALGVGVQEGSLIGTLLFILVKGVILIAAIILFMRYLAEPLLRRLAQSPELLITFAIGWAALFAALGDYLGFSKELGGLLAGISLASTPYREAIGARLVSLRDFLLLFFFINLGARMDLGTLGAQTLPAIVLSLFVLIGNPLIVMIIMGLLGYRKRTGFLAGLTVAQISEFSLIFVAMGLMLGHIGTEAVGLVTLVGLITIGLSTYMILYSQTLYRRLEPLLGIFERKTPHREQVDAAGAEPPGQGFDVILFGLGRYGSNIARQLRQQGLTVFGVDFDPEVVRRWQEQGMPACYGDASDPEFPGSLPLRQAQWVLSALPQHETGLTHRDIRSVLIEALRAHGFSGRFAIAAHSPRDAVRLRRQDVDIILMPFTDAAKQAVEAVVRASGRINFETLNEKV